MRTLLAGLVVVLLTVTIAGPAPAAPPHRSSTHARTISDPVRDSDHGHAWKHHPGLHGEADLLRTRVAVRDRVVTISWRLRQLHRPTRLVQLHLQATGLLRSTTRSPYRTLGVVVSVGGPRRGAQAVAVVNRHQVCRAGTSTTVDVPHARVVARLPVRCLPQRTELEGLTASVNVFVRADGTVGGDTAHGDWTLRLR